MLHLRFHLPQKPLLAHFLHFSKTVYWTLLPHKPDKKRYLPDKFRPMWQVYLYEYKPLKSQMPDIPSTFLLFS